MTDDELAQALDTKIAETEVAVGEANKNRREAEMDASFWRSEEASLINRLENYRIARKQFPF